MTKKSTTVRIGRTYDGQYSEDLRLRDGAEVFVHTLHPEDKATLLEGFERLSKESRFRRFFAYKTTLTSRELEYFTEFDGETHFALAAGRWLADGGVEGLGVARFVQLADRPGEAEFAVAVVDDWHRRGLGRALLVRLVAAAAERHIERVVGTVVAGNESMIRLLASIPQARLSWSGGLVQVVVELDEAVVSPLGRSCPLAGPDGIGSNLPLHSPPSARLGAPARYRD